VNALAGASVEQARELPSVSVYCLCQLLSVSLAGVLCLQRALLNWTLMAVKLLKRSYVSEHLQIRYRTARMLEIWDLAASSIPASPVSLLMQLFAKFPLH